MQEQRVRNNDRYAVELTSFLLIIDEQETVSVESVTKDISAGGAFFETGRPIASGTEVKVDLVMPISKLRMMRANRAHIKVSGVVTRTDKDGIAVCFDKNYQIVSI